MNITERNEKFKKRLEEETNNPRWNCRFHPTDGWHETGCPHIEWSKEQLSKALIMAKASAFVNSEFSLIEQQLESRTPKMGEDEMLKSADRALSKLKEEPNNICTQLNETEAISFNTGFFIGFESGYAIRTESQTPKMSAREWLEKRYNLTNDSMGRYAVHNFDFSTLCTDFQDYAEGKQP
jgi:hypothetical protein